MGTFIDLPIYLEISWLTTIDGKERSKDQAKQITVDVSKYMYFCNAKSINTSCAYDAEYFNKYLTELKDAGLTCSGILVKILRVRNFLDFLLNSVEVNSTEEAKIAKMVTKLKSWQSHFSIQNYKVDILHTLCYHTLCYHTLS